VILARAHISNVLLPIGCYFDPLPHDIKAYFDLAITEDQIICRQYASQTSQSQRNIYMLLTYLSASIQNVTNATNGTVVVEPLYFYCRELATTSTERAKSYHRVLVVIKLPVPPRKLEDNQRESTSACP